MKLNKKILFLIFSLSMIYEHSLLFAGNSNSRIKVNKFQPIFESNPFAGSSKFELDCTVHQNSLLDGSLKIDVSSNQGRFYHTVFINNLSLLSGSNRKIYTLPAISFSSNNNYTQVTTLYYALKFYDNKGELLHQEKFEHTVKIHGNQQLRLLTICTTTSFFSNDYQEFINSFNVLKYKLKKDPKKDEDENPRKYIPPSRKLNELPEIPFKHNYLQLSTLKYLDNSPLNFCGQNIIIITTDACEQLDKRKIKALLKWCKAGGSLAIFRDKDAKSNELFSMFGQQLLEHSKVYNRSYDLGHITLINGLHYNKLLSLPNKQWQKSILKLCRVRYYQQQHLLKNNEWSNDSMNYTSSASPYYYDGLKSLLFPKDIRVIPVWTIFFIIVIFTLLIGPVDYLFLGYLKKRRYTWLLFPFCSMVITIMTMQISKAYLGKGLRINKISIIDCDQDNNCLAHNEFSLYFTGKNGNYELRTSQELLGKIYGPNISNGDLTYSGNILGTANCSAYLPQWSPTIFHSFSFEAPTDYKDINWKSLSELSLEKINSPNTQKIFKNLYKGDTKQNMMILCYHKGKLIDSINAYSVPLLYNMSVTNHTSFSKMFYGRSPSTYSNTNGLINYDASDPQQLLIILYFNDNSGKAQAYRYLHKFQQSKR